MKEEFTRDSELTGAQFSRFIKIRLPEEKYNYLYDHYLKQHLEDIHAMQQWARWVAESGRAQEAEKEQAAREQSVA